MKYRKKIILLIVILVFLSLQGCRDWFGDGNHASSLVTIDDQLPANIEIFTPQYASQWNPGETMPISWITSSSINNITIELYRKNIFQFKIIDGYNNNGEYRWHIPERIDHSLHYLIKIINFDKPAENSISKSFAIRN